LNDLPKLKLAFKDITHVFHCAAYISFDPSNYKILRATNIKGTANIVNLCIANKVEKLCYVSSVATLGYDADLITEETKWEGNQNQSVYAISKYGAEMEVWRASQEGVTAVIINPGVILGPGFWNSGSGLLFKLVGKKQRYFTNGRTGYVAVNDVTKAMLDLMDSDIKNQRYVLVAENLTYKEILTTVAKSMEIAPPTKLASERMLQFAMVYDWLQSKLLGRKRRLSKALCRALTRDCKFSSEKIKTDLKSFKFTPISKATQQVVQYFF
jgi:nucleoside-diphosphate-sugar epimerase